MTFKTQFDPTGETSATVAVVTALADATNTASCELSPLYASVDPDKLDNVVEYGPAAIVQFTYSGYHVTVFGSGQIILEPTSSE